MKKYKTVFIDWNGTLSASKFWGQLEDPKHINNHLFQKIEDSLFGKLRHLIKPWMKAEYKSEDVISHIVSSSDLDYKNVFDEFITGCQKMNYVSSEVIPLIKTIQGRGVKVVIATDNMDSFTRWTVPALKLDQIFDGILNSYDLKAMKGNTDEKGKSLFFDKFLSQYKLQPGESVIIDDSEDKDNTVAGFGIEYRKIEPVIGLVPELKQILSLI